MQPDEDIGEGSALEGAIAPKAAPARITMVVMLAHFAAGPVDTLPEALFRFLGAAPGSRYRRRRASTSPDEAVTGDRGLATRPDADGGDTATGPLLNAQHVVLGRLSGSAKTADSLMSSLSRAAPRRQGRRGGNRIGQRHLLGGGAVDVIGDAHRNGLGFARWGRRA